MTEDINFIELLNVMIRKWWLIAILMIIFGAGTYIYSDLFIQPMYKTDGAIYVNCETEATQITDVASVGRLESNTRLATTYVEILKSRTFLTEVARDLNNKYSYSQIYNMLTIEPVNETELLRLTVECKSPEDACAIVESILMRAGDQLITVVKAGSVEIVDKPYVPTLPFSPNKSRNALLGVIIGGVLAVAIIFLMELFDTHIKTSDEIRQKYDEPILGEIPSFGME